MSGSPLSSVSGYLHIIRKVFPIWLCSLAEALRTAAIIFTKALTEIRCIGEACLLADLHDLHVGSAQKLLGLFQAKLTDKMGKALSGFLFKYVA